MSQSDRVRWSGLALVVAGVLMAVGGALHPDETVAGAMALSNWPLAHVLIAGGMLFGLFGIMGLYARLADGGWPPLAGFVLLVLGHAVFIAITAIEAWIAPSVDALGGEAATLMAMDGPVFGGTFGIVLMGGAIAFALGAVLFAVAIWSSVQLPKWAGPLFGIGAVLAAFSPPLPHIALVVGGLCVGVAYVWLGYVLWSGMQSSSSSLESASA